MSPRSERSVLKRNQPSSPASNNTSPKKPRRSSRVQAKAMETSGVTTTPEEHPVDLTRTPASSPAPQDTQVASQFYYPPLGGDGIDSEHDENVWGYIIPLNKKYGDTLKLNKQGVCPQPSVKQQKKGSKKKVEEKAALTSGYLIGRHPECDLVIDSLVISNRHCVIFKEITDSKPIAILEDLSSNGTWVGGVVVGRNNRRALKSGDEIEIAGGIQFIFRYPPDTKASPFRKTYDLGRALGSGHFATVHLAVEKKSGRQFAVKIFRKRRSDDEKSKTSGLQQEIAMLMTVSHPNVLCLQGTYDEDDGVYLVLELAKKGELFNYIIEKKKLSEPETRKIMLQLLSGLSYLHERNIVHRDIKPENILLCDDDLTVKLADFGLAKIIGEDSFTTSLCGTPSYVAPEVLENTASRKYSKGVDVWSLGVVLYICLCGFPPFSDELCTPTNPHTLSDQIKNGLYEFPSPYWDSVQDSALDLIERMLEVDPDRRITVAKALEHPWVTDTQWNPADSCDSLAGALQGITFVRKKLSRERTMLADTPGFKAGKKLPVQTTQGKGKSEGTDANSQAEASEMAPATKAFMNFGGNGGDETLYPESQDGDVESGANGVVDKPEEKPEEA